MPTMNRRSKIGFGLFLLSVAMLTWGFFDPSISFWQMTAPIWILPAVVVVGFAMAALGVVAGWIGYGLIAAVDALVGVKNESR